jgi:hypothetical protein
MDRQIVYPGSIPLETDLLNTNKNAMIGLAKLAAAILGTSTFMNGLACTPDSPASLNVKVAPGEIYSLQNIDGTAYSSLAADTTHSILKQGIMLDSVLLSCPAPATNGQSINYLVQVAYQDTDANAVVLPYYNASNPSQAYSGPNNTGSQNYTTRKGVCAVSVKAGVAATTGSQTTPAPDAGYTGAYVVTVTYGQTQILAGNISTYASAPFLPSAGLVVGGLQGNACNISAAGGTADAITGIYAPGITTLTNGMTLYVRAASANATTTPTFTPASGTIPAKTIVKGNGLALAARDIAGAGHWIELQYDQALDKWVLLNPATGVNSGSTGNFAGLNSYNASANLPPSDLGKLVVFYGSTAAQTLTLPAVAGVAVGNNYTIVNKASTSVTINGNASENISRNVTGVGQTISNTVVLNPGDSLVFSSNGSNQWNCEGQSAPDMFPNSMAANGYQKLPNGLIIQWGTSASISSSVSSGTITFPVAFPSNAAYVNIIGVGAVTTGANTNLCLATKTATNFSFVNTYLSAEPFNWIAIGY